MDYVKIIVYVLKSMLDNKNYNVIYYFYVECVLKINVLFRLIRKDMWR